MHPNRLPLHQVLLDTLGHEELSDYLALLIPQPVAHHHCSCNKGHSTAKAASTAGSVASQSGGGTCAASHSKGTNSIGMCNITSVPLNRHRTRCIPSSTRRWTIALTQQHQRHPLLLPAVTSSSSIEQQAGNLHETRVAAAASQEGA